MSSYPCGDLFRPHENSPNLSPIRFKILLIALVLSLAIDSGLTHGAQESQTTAPLTFNSTPTPDFAMGATLPSAVPADGTTFATSTIIVSPINDFTKTVTLSSLPLPTGLTCTAIDPAQIPNGTGEATLSSNSIAAGTYHVRVIGTSGGIIHNTTATFRFAAPAPPDFTMVAISSVIITLGSAASSNVTLTPQNGFESKVNLTSTVGPTIGLSVSLNPQSFVRGSGTSRVTFNSSKPGDYTVMIIGTSGSLSHTTTIEVTVSPIASDFGISASSNFIDVEADKSGTTTITITPISGFTGTVTLAVTAPTSISCSLSGSSIHSSGSSGLSCNGRSAGNYSVMITATSGAITHTTTVDVHVAAASSVASLPAPSTILGLSSTLFYGIIAVIVIVAVTGTFLELRRSKRFSS